MTNPSNTPPISAPLEDGWRQTHLGRLLGDALRRFDARVLTLMAHNIDVPLALSNLAARAQVGAAHIHITRQQAMGELVDQCAAWDLVRREPDPLDARARRVCFTPTGLAWLQAFRDAVAQAEAEFRAAVGGDVATVVAIGLESYASESEFLNEA